MLHIAVTSDKRLGLRLRLGPHHRFAFGLVHFRIRLDIMLLFMQMQSNVVSMLSDAVNRVTPNLLLVIDWEIVTL